MDFELDTLDLNSLRIDNDRLDEDNTQKKPAGNDFKSNFVQLPDGNCNFMLRLMPPRKGKKPYVATRLHKINGRFVHCRKELINGKWVGDCAICAYYNKLYKIIDQFLAEGKTAEAEALRAEARGLKAIERYYWNSIVRKEVSKDGNVSLNVGPKVYSCGKMIQRLILTGILGDEEAGEPALGDVMNIKTGRDLKIVKKMVGSGKEVFPRYEGTKFVEPSPLGNDDEIATWIGNMFELAELREVKSNDELEKEIAIHRGIIPDERKNAGFDIDQLDRKFGVAMSGQNTSGPTEVKELVTHTESVEVVQDQTPEAELSVDEEAFIAQLQEMQENA